MVELLAVLFAFVLVSLGFTLLRGRPRHVVEPELEDAPAGRSSPLVRDHPFLPWIVGVVVAVGLVLAIGLVPWIAASVGVVLGVATSIGIRFLAVRRMTRLEFQLADAIDLMVSSLRAGGGLTDAVVGAARETRLPLRPYLHELVERIRLGERPESVLLDLEARIPLESFRLFTFALAAHWQGGGSLATTLSNVGRTIRDRVDVSRRVTSQAVETQVSVVFVLVVTYGLALFMWNNYPQRMEDFATSEIGSMFLGLSILLQGVGLFWISRMTRIEV